MHDYQIRDIDHTLSRIAAALERLVEILDPPKDDYDDEPIILEAFDPHAPPLGYAWCKMGDTPTHYVDDLGNIAGSRLYDLRITAAHDYPHIVDGNAYGYIRKVDE